MRIKWVTGAEVGSWGFHLWRSTMDSIATRSYYRTDDRSHWECGGRFSPMFFFFFDDGMMVDTGYGCSLVETELDSNLRLKILDRLPVY